MKVYILDVKSISLERMLLWLSDNRKISAVKLFDDYIKFIEEIGKSPPDLCIIRLGNDRIPGIKTAGMVQSINPEIRIVFVSDDRDYAVDAYEVGAYGYLLSPVEKIKLDKCLFIREE